MQKWGGKREVMYTAFKALGDSVEPEPRAGRVGGTVSRAPVGSAEAQGPGPWV